MRITRKMLFLSLAIFTLEYTILAQSPRDKYEAIQEIPSPTHWCLPAAGDDPASIIEHVCSVYMKCLESADLPSDIYGQLPSTLSDEQRQHAKACHQALFNAAKVNPQIKGSKATQAWLESYVAPGTEAKSFAVPASMNNPH
jgi:hypothetical protein